MIEGSICSALVSKYNKISIKEVYIRFGITPELMNLLKIHK